MSRLVDVVTTGDVRLFFAGTKLLMHLTILIISLHHAARWQSRHFRLGSHSLRYDTLTSAARIRRIPLL